MKIDNSSYRSHFEKLTGIIEHSTNVFYTHTTDNIITFISPQVEEVLGYNTEEAKTRWTEFATNNPLNKKGFESTARAINTGKRQTPYEMELVRKDGKKIWVEIREAPVLENGKVKAIIGSLTDITERKIAREELKKSEQNFKAIFENTGAATCIINEDHRIELANERFAELAGYPLPEIENKKRWTEFVLEEDLEKMLYQHRLRRQKPQEALRNYEFKFRNKAGELKDILLYIDMIPGTDKSVASLLDITIRKKAEIEAGEHRERYKSLFEQAADGILVGIGEGEIIEANESFCKLTNFSKEELIGKNISFLFDKRELEKKPLRYDLVKKGQKVIFERKITSKKGRSIIVEMSTKMLSDGRMQALFRDITDRKIAEEKLKRINRELKIAKDKAEESDRLKSAFLANMSHEIRTPMNGILGFTQLLLEPGLSGKQQEVYLDIIQKSGYRMLDTVNDLIDISRIETGQVDVTISEVNVNEEVENLYNFFAPEARKKGLKMSLAKQVPEFETIIKTDAVKLTSILTNLIKNSIKYTDEGFIEIGYSKENMEFIFYVKDTGFGIPKSRQKAIFERFTQADIDNKKAIEGSGLGLSITKAYLEMLGGKIWLDSLPGRGSTFYFSLPVNKF